MPPWLFCSLFWYAVMGHVVGNAALTIIKRESSFPPNVLEQGIIIAVAALLWPMFLGNWIGGRV